MKTIASCIPLAALVLFITACSNPRYINNPSVHNASFFREKGDLKFSGAFAANPNDLFSDIDLDSNNKNELDRNLGFDVQAAYAITDHFMIQAAGMYRWEKDVFNDDDLMNDNNGSKVTYKRSMVDLGAGYYTALGNSRKVYFNGVLGAGLGSSKSTDIGSPVARHRHYDFDFVKYYLSPAFNFFFSEQARLSFAPRFSLLTTNNIKTDYTEEEQQILGYHTLKNKGKVFFEPSLVFQGGFPNLPWMKLDVGLHFASNPLTTTSNDDGPPTVTEEHEVRSRNFLLSLGLSFYPFAGRR